MADRDSAQGGTQFPSGSAARDEAVVLLIPAYRPSPTLPELVREIRDTDRFRSFRSIVVVDDGSGEQFRPTFAQLEGAEGVTVLRHAVNLGKGAALKTGFNHILLNFPQAAGVVTADADGQHAVDDILQVARVLVEHPDDMVLGVRAFSGDVPLRSRLGNSITRSVFRFFTGVGIVDTQTGLRGWPQSFCRESLPVAINGYDFELECLLRAHHAGNGTLASVRQVPIKTIYLDNNQSSHFSPIRDSMRIYFVFIRYCGGSMMAALIDNVSFYFAHGLTNNIVISQIAGRLVATSVAFTVNRKLVFRSDARVLPSLTKYLALVTVMGFVSYGMLTYLHRVTGLPIIPCKLIAEGLLFLANFSIQRQVIFVRTRRNRYES
ncbi:MAG: hypothetical protein C5B51_02975 [Terriglobia bacterium]|nr:MAG: hypothetical protein C5B51_02975 [Terriglobia bacterium]